MESVYDGVFEFDADDRDKIDKHFKANIRVEKIDNKRLRGYTTVFNELEFFTWIFQSEGRFKLVGPEKVLEKFKKMLSVNV